MGEGLKDTPRINCDVHGYSVVGGFGMTFHILLVDVSVGL